MTEAAPASAAPDAPTRDHDIAAWALTGTALLFILQFHLLPALFAGLLVHQLVDLIAPQLTRRLHLGEGPARIAAVALLFGILIAVIALATSGVVISIRSGTESVPELLRRMAEIIEARRDSWPQWLVALLPADASEFQSAAVNWLREHAGALQGFGASAGRAMTYVLVGMIIGSIVALSERATGRAPLAQALALRVAKLEESFHRVVFAQVRISALNTGITVIYLTVALPLLGIHLPLTKTLIAVTFACGLLPVLGNLISNTIIVIVSLSHSWELAAASLIYLVVVHKLEYFLNARIVGTQIRARAWEMLIAMLTMEAAFGIPGVVAAPIYYAYLKNELSANHLI